MCSIPHSTGEMQHAYDYAAFLQKIPWAQSENYECAPKTAASKAMELYAMEIQYLRSKLNDYKNNINGLLFDDDELEDIHSILDDLEESIFFDPQSEFESSEAAIESDIEVNETASMDLDDDQFELATEGQCNKAGEINERTTSVDSGNWDDNASSTCNAPISDSISGDIPFEENVRILSLISNIFLTKRM